MNRSSLPVAVFITVASAVLWVLALGELSQAPTTYSGTQSYQRVNR